MDELQTTGHFAQEIFARGYLITDSAIPTVPPHWERAFVGDCAIHHDPRLRASVAKRGAVRVLCLGVLFDVRHPERDTAECTDRLAEALERGEQAFFDLLHHSCGRHVILYEHAGGRFLLTDATGMKPAYYHRGKARYVSSHARLISSCAPDDAAPAAPVYAKFGHPGIRAPFENTFLLTPNTRLCLDTFAVRRFWPLRPLGKLPLEQAVERFRANMSGAMEHVTRYYTPVVSVTAGMDSRVTLSLCRGRPGIRYFTYFRKDDLDTDGHDKAFAADFSTLSGCDVSVFDMSRMPTIAPEFLEMQRINTTFDHIKSVAWAYWRNFAGVGNALHIRSNVSEVGREFYRGKQFEVTSGRDLARIYLQGDKAYPARYVFDVIGRFEEFAEISGILDCAGMLDPKNLFYWEFRMASWHSGVVAESDPAFDTVSLYNCRDTLETLLSAPLQARRRSMVLRKAIAENWPELTKYRINGKAFWPDFKK